VGKVRENIHICLTFSPAGGSLRKYCLQFPSIINCCTIDWFDKWPEEALQSVAIKEFEGQSKLGLEKFVDPLAQTCKIIHRTVEEFSEKFYDELRRKNYTTPTSYLQLIFLYKKLLKS